MDGVVFSIKSIDLGLTSSCFYFCNGKTFVLPSIRD